MARERKPYARYFIVRGHQALWKGDPAQNGSPFRQFVITSDEFNSTDGMFQVYGLEGIGKGVQNGKFARSDEEPIVLFDQDFEGLSAASKKFDELVQEAQARGFKRITLMDVLEFEAKLNASH